MTHRLVPRGATLLRVVFLFVTAGVVGQLAAKRMTTGDDSSEVFRLAAIMGGKDFTSDASNLQSGSAIAVMGGLEIDLREAHLDPGAARLDITAVMGGVEVLLPRGWAVDVEPHGMLGGVDVRVNESADVPDGAPILHVTTHTWLGGVQIRDDR
jgi:predicted membrane protein